MATEEEQQQAGQRAFQELADLEGDFETAELEILKYSTEKLKPLYEKRRDVAANIPRFWAIVVDQAGDEFDQYVTPRDGALLEHISELDVIRDIEDPRSFTLVFKFFDNDFLENNLISKKFTYIDTKKEETEEESDDIIDEAKIKYKSTKSEIKWKKGKDLTKTKKGEPFSFFTFFDWENSDDESKTDIFDKAYEVAILLSDEVFPNASKLFTDAIEEEDDEEEDDEIDLEDDEDEDEEEDEEEEEEEEEARPKKKQKK
ncbi:hypothetical protein V1514DRAFT_349753 [Lipomyces japonicus]|uniref:uncharacterized protein n=1 Tax=Lipomyces japonicus TaxID=56871 RepID=UPI0034CF4901